MLLSFTLKKYCDKQTIQEIKQTTLHPSSNNTAYELNKRNETNNAPFYLHSNNTVTNKLCRNSNEQFVIQPQAILHTIKKTTQYRNKHTCSFFIYTNWAGNITQRSHSMYDICHTNEKTRNKKRTASYKLKRTILHPNSNNTGYKLKRTNRKNH